MQRLPYPVIFCTSARFTMRKRCISGKCLKLVFTAPWVNAVPLAFQPAN